MYEELYNLTGDPFRLSPDHRFCFRHRSYAKARAYLRYGLERAEGFVMITGAPGTGKTTLIDDLLATYGTDDLVIAHLTSGNVAGDDLLRMAAYGFDIDVEGLDKATLLRRLGSYLAQRRHTGRRALLIVDEAQDLSAGALEELRLLTNLQLEGQPLLQIFLLGQEGLGEIVRSPRMEQLHQRLIAACHLVPLTHVDTRQYIEHRLARAGWQGDPSFTDDVYDLIYKHTRGVPRRINQLFSRLLLHGALEQKHAIDAGDVRSVVEELRNECLLPHGDTVTEHRASTTDPVDEPAPRAPGADPKESPETPVSESTPDPQDATSAPPPSSQRTSAQGSMSGMEGPADSSRNEPATSPATTAHADTGKPSPAQGAATRHASAPARPALTPDTAAAVPPRQARPPAPQRPPSRGPLRPPRGHGTQPQARAQDQRPEIERSEATTASQAPRRRIRRLWLVVLALIIAGPIVAYGIVHAVEDWSLDTMWLNALSGIYQTDGDASARSTDGNAGEAGSPRQTGVAADGREDGSSPAASSSDPERAPDPRSGHSADAGKEDEPSRSHSQDGSSGPTAASAGDREDSPNTQSSLATADDAMLPTRFPLGWEGPVAAGWRQDLVEAPGSAQRESRTRRSEYETPTATPSRSQRPSANDAAKDDTASASPRTAEGSAAALTGTLTGLPGEVQRLPDGRVRIGLPTEAAFAFDSSKLKPESRSILDEIAAVMERYPQTHIRVVGHTDHRGPSEYNEWLSRRRARAVSRYLDRRGIAPQRMQTEGRGATDPIDLDGPPRTNRRVEIFITP